MIIAGALVVIWNQLITGILITQPFGVTAKNSFEYVAQADCDPILIKIGLVIVSEIIDMRLKKPV